METSPLKSVEALAEHFMVMLRTIHKVVSKDGDSPDDVLVDFGSLPESMLDMTQDLLSSKSKSSGELIESFKSMMALNAAFLEDFSPYHPQIKPAFDMLAWFNYSVGVMVGKEKCFIVDERIRAEMNKVEAERARRSLDRASARRRQQGDVVRQAARADILRHPHTSQAACAQRVAALTDKDERHVNRQIESMFMKRANGRGKVPRPEFRKSREI